MPLLRWSGVAGVAAVFSGRRGGVSDGAYESLNLGLRSGDDLGRVAENRRRVCAAAAVDPGAHVVVPPVPLRRRARGGGRARPAVRRHVGGLAPRRRPRHAPARPRRRRVRVGLRAGRGGAHRRHRRRRLPRRLARPAGRRRRAHGRGPRRRRPRGGRRPVRGARRLRGGRRRGRARCASASARPRCAAPTPTSRPAPRIALERAGVGAVDVAGLCTITDAERFFSYRRDGDACGRQAVIAHLEAVDG